MKDLTANEQIIYGALIAARDVQDFIWGDKSLSQQEGFSKEDWVKTFQKRVDKISQLDINHPSYEVELRKRVLQQASLSISASQFLNRRPDNVSALRLEIGKWYLTENGSFINYQGNGDSYGIHAGCKSWFKNKYWDFSSVKREVFNSEIEVVLKDKAAELGIFLNCVWRFHDGSKRVLNKPLAYDAQHDELTCGAYALMSGGEWTGRVVNG